MSLFIRDTGLYFSDFVYDESFWLGTNISVATWNELGCVPPSLCLSEFMSEAI